MSDDLIRNTFHGLTDKHIEALGLGISASEDFTAMRNAALESGIHLSIASGFRSFERQLTIWNKKASGLLSVTDDDNALVDVLSQTPIQRIHSILRFSALPGFSRHHWGTDFDYYDANAMPDGYQLQLIRNEYEGEHAIFAKSHQWLIQNASNFGFRFPYSADTGGVAQEPWHLSHVKSAKAFEDYLNQFEASSLPELFSPHHLIDADVVMENFSTLHSRYMTSVNIK